MTSPARIAHPNHEHALKLVVPTGADAKFKCNGCKEVGAGDRYMCEFDPPCDFNLHEDCALAEDTLVHPLFDRDIYKFELRREAPDKNNERLCDACGTHVDGWYYHCDRKELDLHPWCAKLPMEIKHEELTFELRRKATHRCNICHGSGGYGTFWYYRSTCKTVYLHVRCVKKHIITRRNAASDGDMIPFVRNTVLIKGYRGEKTGTNFLRICKIVATVLRIIIGVIIGDPTTIIAASVLALN